MNPIQTSAMRPTNSFSANINFNTAPRNWQMNNTPVFNTMINQVVSLLLNLLQGIQGNQTIAKPAPIMPNNSAMMGNSTMMAKSPDAPQPIIELMSYFKTIESQLGITPAQRNIIDPWVAVAKPKREGLEAEYAVIRGQLREAMLSGADEATTTALTDQMLGKEREILLLKAECARLLKSTLNDSQYAQLIASYNSAKNVDHGHKV